ncbi:hypothetical protein NVR04_06325 [Staphylococcus pseudintermedius]|uniref:hypothetical protein n=1 Tax=Staphylococcus pseudintermedius TaxID=283734 RepID=UPI0015E85B12|nr:hypothetical protein [Staphylococcus pseudintermedius]EGQ2754681.1 hypothetical protein [Staphylococcus pseudintermedius]EGQ3478287.1 hypothetical protein [Staphylococcus pseudintermedius]EHL7278792.1 hypothetical protein [Staphylococcus pseudintermedius]EIE3770115.1 hypothetical protein [Staphylococcus pseudintermedius]EII6288095.1 hypothetical protein [Staphylococcus pseudintermedius]
MQKARHFYHRDVGLFQDILPNWTDVSVIIQHHSTYILRSKLSHLTIEASTIE